jgi:hypothetical protein
MNEATYPNLLVCGHLSRVSEEATVRPSPTTVTIVGVNRHDPLSSIHCSSGIQVLDQKVRQHHVRIEHVFVPLPNGCNDGLCFGDTCDIDLVLEPRAVDDPSGVQGHTVNNDAFILRQAENEVVTNKGVFVFGLGVPVKPEIRCLLMKSEVLQIQRRAGHG